MMMKSTGIRIEMCDKCTTTKAGKLSCCARGGAWFKNCGDVGETDFEHTWAEGIQACKTFVTLPSGQSPLLHTLDSVGVSGDADRSRDRDDKKMNIYPSDGINNVATNDIENCFVLPIIVTITCVVFVFL